MKIDIVTIFPEFFRSLDQSLLGKAQEKGIVDINVHDLRAVTTDRHRTVDDTPYGGGAGMVMRPDIWGRMLDQLVTSQPNTVIAIPTPTGKTFTQRDAEKLASAEHIVFACGRYEGIDSRVARSYGSQVWEFSLGDYVLNGGESATLVAIEAITRLLDGAVGNPESVVEESHSSEGLLEYDIFTKPQQWKDLAVPAVLLSGDHQRVAQWRRENALIKTATRRPDMIAELNWDKLSELDREILACCGYANAQQTVSYQYCLSPAGRSDTAGEADSLLWQTLPPLAEHNTAQEIIPATATAATITAQIAGEIVASAAISCLDDTGLATQLKAVTPSIPANTVFFSGLRVHHLPSESVIPGALIERACELACKLWPQTTQVATSTQEIHQYRGAKFLRSHGFKRCAITITVSSDNRKIPLFIRDISHAHTC